MACALVEAHWWAGSEPTPHWALAVLVTLSIVLGFVIARHVYYGKDKFR